jgi:uncharacterized protein
MFRLAGRASAAAVSLRVASRRIAWPVLLLCGFSTPALAQTIPLSGGTYSQNFDTLSNTAGSTTNTALPSGWLLNETGGGARDNEQYAVDTGSSNTGDTYSYGSAGSTERAFGGLRSGTLVASIGACFSNATGGTLTGFDIAYTGEQWRLGTPSRTDALSFEYSVNATSLTTGTWTGVTALNFITPNTTGTAGARDGNAAANRTALTATVGGVAIANGATFCIRWNDADASGADDGLTIDDFSITVGGTPTPALSVNDTAADEGNSGTTPFFFTLSLSQPAGVDGVEIEYATADGTATTAGGDYTFSALTVTIPEGSSSVTISVDVNGDTTPEANETFFVNILSANGAVVADAQGLGTIQNDDVAIVPISQIQGSGLTSPLVGAVVTTEGIVTAQKFNNGFFLQTTDASVDADPNTSEGIFVFTSTAPPASAAVGNRVRVTGTVAEFTPSSNPNQLSITQLTAPTIVVVSTGNPLPTPYAIGEFDFQHGQLPSANERLEGMRVSLAQGRVVGASDGNITESSANSTTTGVFYVVHPTEDRPFREPGISVLDVVPIPAGKNPPRFDSNQERIMVRSRGQIGATALAVDADATVSNLIGVLDYFSGTWALLPDPSAGIVAAGGKTATAVSDARYEDVTIASFNLLRFFDEINDANGGPTLTAAALDKRLTKTSLAICDYLKAPDILGVVEVENLRVLGLLADRINSTCARAPQYVPYLVQGNDQGGINVGFLVSTRTIGANPRVDVLEVTQFGKNTLLVNPDNSTALLNDRPPLLLRANVRQDNGAGYPVTVIVSHLRSLNGIDDTTPGSAGWPTEGERVRTKRGQQAMFLANLVQTRQSEDQAEHIVLIGDFNAFEFNDGYVDLMGIIRGDEAAEPSVLSYFNSPIFPPLTDGSELILAPADKYSYVFEGSAQTLDHVVVNEPIVTYAADIRVDHARINADFGVHNFGVAGNAIRTSDHDPVRLRISVAAFRSADLGIVASAAPTTIAAGGSATFTATATNTGPNDAEFPAVALVFNALVSPTVEVNGPPNWRCDAPVQSGGNTTVACRKRGEEVFAVGESVTITAIVATTLAQGGTSLQMAAAVSSQTSDPANGNNQASASVAINAAGNANMSVALLGGPIGPNGLQGTGPTSPGGTVQFVIPVRNLGPDLALRPQLTLTGDVPLASATLIAPAGWNCTRSATGTGFAMNCELPRALRRIAGEFFNLTIVTPNRSGTLTVDATVSSATPDPVSSNNTARRVLQIL